MGPYVRIKGLRSPLQSPFGFLYNGCLGSEYYVGYSVLQKLILEDDNVKLHSSLTLEKVPLYSHNVSARECDKDNSEYCDWERWLGPKFASLAASPRNACTENETLTRLRTHLLTLPVDREF